MNPLVLIAQVNAEPDPNGLPGSNVLEQMVDGLLYLALLGCLAAMLIGAAVWAFASRGHNPHYAQMGKGAALIAFFGAIVAAAAPALINFASDLGNQVK
jgi:hypothetical protein